MLHFRLKQLPLERETCREVENRHHRGNSENRCHRIACSVSIRVSHRGTRPAACLQRNFATRVAHARDFAGSTRTSAGEAAVDELTMTPRRGSARFTGDGSFE